MENYSKQIRQSLMPKLRMMLLSWILTEQQVHQQMLIMVLVGYKRRKRLLKNKPNTTQHNLLSLQLQIKLQELKQL